MTLTLELPSPAEHESAEQRKKRLQAALALYDAHLVSQGVGAELAGLSRAEFIDALGQAGIAVLQYTAEEALWEARKK